MADNTQGNRDPAQAQTQANAQGPAQATPDKGAQAQANAQTPDKGTPAQATPDKGAQAQAQATPDKGAQAQANAQTPKATNEQPKAQEPAQASPERQALIDEYQSITAEVATIQDDFGAGKVSMDAYLERLTAINARRKALSERLAAQELAERLNPVLQGVVQLMLDSVDEQIDAALESNGVAEESRTAVRAAIMKEYSFHLDPAEGEYKGTFLKVSKMGARGNHQNKSAGGQSSARAQAWRIQGRVDGPDLNGQGLAHELGVCTYSDFQTLKEGLPDGEADKVWGDSLKIGPGKTVAYWAAKNPEASAKINVRLSRGDEYKELTLSEVAKQGILGNVPQAGTLRAYDDSMKQALQRAKPATN